MINRKFNEQVNEAKKTSAKHDFLAVWDQTVEPILKKYQQTLLQLEKLLKQTRQGLAVNQKIEQDLKSRLAVYEQALTDALNALLSNLEQYDLIRITNIQATQINKCLNKIYQLGCLLLSNDILISASSIFLCETSLRNYISVHALRLTDNTLRNNHIENFQEKFFSPASWLGLIHTMLKILQIYKISNNNPEQVTSTILKLQEYFQKCDAEIQKITTPKAQYVYYYKACQVEYEIIQDNFSTAARLLTQLPDHQINDDPLKPSIIELIIKGNYQIALNFYSQQKFEEALIWFNNCLPHLKYLPPNVQQHVELKIKELEPQQAQRNLQQFNELIDNLNLKNYLKIAYDAATGKCEIYILNPSHAFLLRKALRKSQVNFQETKDKVFTLSLAYLPIPAIKGFCYDIERLASLDVKAPYIPYELIETVPDFKSAPAQTENQNIDPVSQDDATPTEKEQKLERHLQNERERQQRKTEAEDSQTQSNVTEERAPQNPNKTAVDKDTLTWHKNYPAIQKNAKQGTLIQYFPNRKAYFHFFLDNTVTKDMAKNHVLSKKVNDLLEDPTRTFGKQGILFVSDRAGNRFFKLRLLGLGNGNGARIGGYIDDMVLDAENDPHYAVNLNICKLKHN